jgi:hypothetical protein
MPIVDVDPATGREIQLMDAFCYNGQYKVRAKGYQATAANNATTNVDFAIGASDRYLQGVRLILQNHVFGDYAQFQVVDVDNIFGQGAGVVLNQFAYDWNCVSESEDQGIVAFTYTARIPAGVYIRIVYTSTSGVSDPNVKILLNLLLHEKVA